MKIFTTKRNVVKKEREKNPSTIAADKHQKLRKVIVFPLCKQNKLQKKNARQRHRVKTLAQTTQTERISMEKIKKHFFLVLFTFDMNDDQIHGFEAHER